MVKFPCIIRVYQHGDIVEIDFNYSDENYDNISPNYTKKLDIIYEDDWILVVNKENNLTVHPSFNHYQDNLASIVRAYFEKINLNKTVRIVNRLDKGTGGIVIIAKCDYIHEKLQNSLILKEYLAIATGKVNDFGIIDLPISRKENSIIERKIDDNGQNALTKYELLKYNKKLNLSLVKCQLLTGRTHQIRVHFKAINHSLLGDTLYGEYSDLIDSQALCCSHIKFKHPITNQMFDIDINNKSLYIKKICGF